MGILSDGQMKVTEISKDEFKDRLKDPRQSAVREKIKEFERIIAKHDFDLVVNEKPYYDGVWSMKAIARNPEPQKAVEHPNLQDVRVSYYMVFTHFEREHDVTIMRNDENVNSILWHIHFK